MSEHAAERCRQRKITQDDIELCIKNGEIIEQYEDDFPWPSCLIYGNIGENKVIHIVASDNGSFSKIVTAYIPDTKKFEDNLKTRREK